MCEMFTRARPYGGLNPHKAAFQAASIGLRPTLPSNLLPMLKSLIERCWAQEPADRPSSSDVLYVLQQNMHLAEVIVEHSGDDTTGSFSVDEMSMSEYDNFNTESLTAEEVAMQLIHCVQENDAGAVRRMLSLNTVDINCKLASEENKTPLHFATTTEMTRLLCDHGALPYIVDDAGDTPLHNFYRLGLSSCIQVLLTNGYRDDIRNNDGLVARECLDVDAAIDRVGRDRAADDMRWLISQNSLVSLSAEQIMQYLHRLSQLKAWNVFAILLEVYREPSISFNGFDLQREGFLAIVEVLKRKHFKTLDLVNNGLWATRDSQGLILRKLISLLRACATTLVDLDIRENGFGDEAALVEPIKACSVLKCLNGNRFPSPPIPLDVVNCIHVFPSSTYRLQLRAELQQLKKRLADIENIGRSLPMPLFLETKDNVTRQKEIDRELVTDKSILRSEPLAVYEVAFIVRQLANSQNCRTISFSNLYLSREATKEITEVQCHELHILLLVLIADIELGC